MLIYGGGQEHKVIGRTHTIQCPQCEFTAPWLIVQTNMKATLYFVPVAKWNKKFFAVCESCDSGIELRDRTAATLAAGGTPLSTLVASGR